MTLADVRTEHPLAMTTAEEVERVRAALAEAGLLGDTVRFAFFLARGAAEGRGARFSDGDVVDRRFRVALLDLATGRSWDTVVSATNGEVVSSRELDPATDGQPPIIDAEFDGRRGDPERRRGLGGRAGEARASTRRRCGRRRCRRASTTTPTRRAAGSCASFGFRPGPREGPPLGAPDRRPRRLRRPHRAARSTGSSTTRRCRCRRSAGNFDDPEVRRPPRDTLKPIEITQPEGRASPSRATGVRWGKLGPAGRLRRARGPHPAPGRLRRAADRLPGVDRRDGRALRRPVARAVLAELLRRRRVPARPRTPTRWSWAATASARSTTSTPSSPTTWAPRRRSSNAICMHEEDYGVLWKHTDLFTGAAETRRQRRLVISFFTTDRQLRLRLLLVPLPRRHHPARGQGHRHRVHLRATAGRHRVRHRDRARPRRAVPPAPVLRAAGHDRRRARATPSTRSTPSRVPMGAGQPVRQRVHARPARG